MGSVGVLRHEAALRDARTEDEVSQAWQRACAFIQSELKILSVGEEMFRDSYLSLLQSCRAYANKSRQYTWLQHFATLQYQVIRTLHERGDHQLVVAEGAALLLFLAELSAAGVDVTTVQANCLVAVISSCARGPLKLDLSTTQLLCNGSAFVAEQDPAQGAQLAKNLVLSQVNAAREMHRPLNHAYAHELLLLVDSCISASTDLSLKLVSQLARAIPATTIASLLQRSGPLQYQRYHVQALLSEYVRRFADEFPTQHGDPLSSIALMEQLASQIQETPSPEPTLASMLHSCAALVKYIALHLKPQSSNTWAAAMSRALEVLCLCCQRADMLMQEVPEPARKPGQPLPQALRRLSASTFNASIDVRKEQPCFALGLLLASASCCVVMATRCDLGGETDAIQQLVRDSIKRCMLGFNTAAETGDRENFLATGLHILCTLCTCAEDDACRGSIVLATTQLLMVARTLFKQLQTNIHGVRTLSCATSAQQVLDWHQSMIRTSCSVRMIIHSMSNMYGAGTRAPDIVVQVIPLLLDCSAIASLSLCTTAVTHISDALLLAAGCSYYCGMSMTDDEGVSLPNTRTYSAHCGTQANSAHSLCSLACIQLLPPRLMADSTFPVLNEALVMLQCAVGGGGVAVQKVLTGISEEPRRRRAQQRDDGSSSADRGNCNTCVTVLLEASAAAERLSLQGNTEKSSSTFNESAISEALGAALKLVHMADSASASCCSVQHRSLAVELYSRAAEVMEYVADILGSRVGETAERDVSIEEFSVSIKGSAVSCSQRLLLASCKLMEHACSVCEECLLEGSESTADVQFNTEDGDRGQHIGSSKDAVLSVGGIGCWHLAVQMIHAAHQCGRLSNALGLGYRARRWQNLLQKLFASLDLPLASVCFLQVPGELQPQTIHPTAGTENLSGDPSEPIEPSLPEEQAKVPERSTAPLAAESAAALTASVALLATESSLPLLGAGLAAQAVEIVVRHKLKSVPQLGGQGTGDVAQSEGVHGPVLEWSAELLSRCQVPCTDGPNRHVANRVKAGTGKENSTRSRTGRRKVPDNAGGGKGKAPASKSKKDSTSSDLSVPYIFPFPSFKILTDMESHSPEDSSPLSRGANKADSKGTCIRLMCRNLSAVHKRLAASMHLDALHDFVCSTVWSGESASVNVMEHHSSKFILEWLEEESPVRFSTPPVLPCTSSTKDVKVPAGDQPSPDEQAPKRQARCKRTTASSGSKSSRAKASKEASTPPLTAVHAWVRQLLVACTSSASPTTAFRVAGCYLSSLAAVCCRQCLSSLCDTGDSLQRTWYSQSASGTCNKKSAWQSGTAESEASRKVEFQVTVLLLCAAIATTGLRAPASAPLLQQLACVTSVAGMSSLPLACTYASNTLASMHAALLSAPNRKEASSTSSEEAQRDHRARLTLMATLGNGENVEAADGEALALHTLQVLSESVRWQEFGLQDVESCIHATVQKAWGSARESLCICHMHASQGIPPFLLASSWLSRGDSLLNGSIEASASVQAAASGSGGPAVARAAALLLHTDAKSELELPEAEESDSSRASTSTDSSAAQSDQQQKAPGEHPAPSTSGNQAPQEATVDAFQAVLDTIERILAESSSGCKRWTAAWTSRSKNSAHSDGAAAVQGGAESGGTSADDEAEEGAESCDPADDATLNRPSARRATARNTKASKSRSAQSTARSDEGSADAGGSSMPGSTRSKRGNVEHGSSSNGPATPAPSQDSAKEGTKRQWWEWRVRLDAELAGAAADLNHICGGALHHCMQTSNDAAAAEPSALTRAQDVKEGDVPNAGTATGGAGPPLRLSLDWDMHRVPWETLPALSQHSVFRSFPSYFGGQHTQMNSSCSTVGSGNRDGAGVLDIDAAIASYIVDPSGDLPGTRQRFEQWFQEVPGWVGSCGTPALEGAELRQSMEQHDLFVYLGHGAGVHLHDSACLPTPAPAAVLMGCSSGKLRSSCSAPGNALVGPVSTYATHGSPCVVVNLWDVTDRDIDRFTQRLLSSVVPGAPDTSKTSKKKHTNATADALGPSGSKAALSNVAPPGTPTRMNASAAAEALAAMTISTQPGINDDLSTKARGRQPAVQLPVPSTPQTGRKGRIQRMHGSAATATAYLSPKLACEDTGVRTPARMTSKNHSTVAPMSVTTPATARRRGRLQRMTTNSQLETEMPAQLRQFPACVEEGSETEQCATEDNECNTVVEPPSLGKMGNSKGTDSQSAARASDDGLMATCVAQSRNACLLRFLNGAAPVCYGVPTRWQSTGHQSLYSRKLQF